MTAHIKIITSHEDDILEKRINDFISDEQNKEKRLEFVDVKVTYLTGDYSVLYTAVIQYSDKEDYQ